MVASLSWSEHDTDQLRLVDFFLMFYAFYSQTKVRIRIFFSLRNHSSSNHSSANTNIFNYFPILKTYLQLHQGEDISQDHLPVHPTTDYDRILIHEKQILYFKISLFSCLSKNTQCLMILFHLNNGFPESK